MSKKQKAYAFEFFSLAVIFLSAFGVYVMLQSLVLVYPEPAEASVQPRLSPVEVVEVADDLVIEEIDFDLEQSLQAAVDEFVETQNNDYSIYIKHLPSNSVATHKSSETLLSASLYKLFAAQLAYKQVDSGNWNLGQVIDDERKLSLEECLDIMITESDNVCGRIILKRLGLRNVNNQTMTSYGYPSTDLNLEYTVSSAEDVASLLEKVYKNQVLNTNSSQAFIDLLAAQKINDRLPQGLPDGVQIMHKTGDLKGFVHDAGIVRSFNGDYIIVVMAGPDETTKTYQQRYHPFEELSRSVYEVITKT